MHGGNEVYVTGSFNNCQCKLNLTALLFAPARSAMHCERHVLILRPHRPHCSTVCACLHFSFLMCVRVAGQGKILMYPNEDGDFTLLIDIPPGTHHYKYIVDQEWSDHGEAERRGPRAWARADGWVGEGFLALVLVFASHQTKERTGRLTRCCTNRPAFPVPVPAPSSR